MTVDCGSLVSTLILLVCVLPAPQLTVAEGTCKFPDFLQSVEKEGELKPWSTRLWWLHLRHVPKWAEKQEVYVRGSYLWRYRYKNPKKCDRNPRRVYSITSMGQHSPCPSDRELSYNMTCIEVQGYSKYRVIQYNADRTHRFTCLKFIRRSENVVQVFEGPKSESNDDDLCDDDNLTLEEWPWIAPWQNRPYFCPVSGGFTFRTIRRLTNEDFCEDEWRRSHLEIECVRGDGLHFMAPSGSNCNPFLKKGDFKSLTCWAGWEEGEYIFLVAAEQNKPRYCLRFPKLQNGEFSVLIYFSVICPTKHDGNPGHGIEYYELRMRRKDLFMCEDEDRLQCKVVADNGGCSKEKEFVKHCPRSCKVCGGKLEEEKSRVHCWFDPRMLGEWILYDKDRTEDVLVDRDTLSFSLFGDFRCETVISENDYVYKTVSLFKNGCSERYTCFEFKRRNNNVLQYRVGKSLRRDAEADELCNFRSDRYPLLDDYRSFWFKNLILARNLWPSYCGLNSNIPFNGTFSGEVCEGEVGDWDPETCTTRGTIIFRSSTCTSLIMPIEFQCLAYVPASESSMHQFLITRSMDGQNEYNCWILSNYVKGIKWPDRIMYRMPTTQCSTLMEAEIGIIVEAKATLFLDDKSRTKVCKPDHETQTAVTHEVMSKSTSVQYVIPDQNKGNPYVAGSQRPQADGSSPTPPSDAASKGSDNSCCPPFKLFTLVLAALVASSSSSPVTSSALLAAWSLLLSSASVYVAWER